MIIQLIQLLSIRHGKDVSNRRIDQKFPDKDRSNCKHHWCQGKSVNEVNYYERNNRVTIFYKSHKYKLMRLVSF